MVSCASTLFLSWAVAKISATIATLIAAVTLLVRDAFLIAIVVRIHRRLLFEIDFRGLNLHKLTRLGQREK